MKKNGISSEDTEFYKEYLEICFNHLKEGDSSESSEVKMKKFSIFKRQVCLFLKENSRRKNRSIYLINKILDYSEKNGVGLLKSHISLGSGELFTFHIELENLGHSQNMEKIFWQESFLM